MQPHYYKIRNLTKFGRNTKFKSMKTKPTDKEEEVNDTETETNNKDNQVSSDKAPTQDSSEDNDIHQQMAEFVDNLSDEEFKELQNVVQYRLDQEESTDEEAPPLTSKPKSKGAPKSKSFDFDMTEMMGGNNEESDKESITTA